MINRRATFPGLLAGSMMPLGGCKILLIGGEAAALAGGFDAERYAEGLWTERALPHFAESAKPANIVLPAIGRDLAAAGAEFGYRPGEGSPWSFVVQGTGTVTAKNTASRAGTLVLALDGAPTPTEATLQIGPVIRGNAVRDALPFVSFKDFTNQLEYAGTGRALTALAIKGFGPEVETLAVGDRVEFTGVIAVSKAGDAPLVTPITVKRAPA